MSASYQLRLLFQCLSLFFVVHLLFSCAVLALTPLAAWCAHRIRPARGLRLLLLFRLLPMFAATYAALALALPSYLRFEPNSDSEPIGIWAVVSAVLAIAIWIRPITQTIHALHQSAQFVNGLEGLAQPLSVAANRIWMIAGQAPRIAVAGLLRPRVLLSQAAIEMFSPEELELVLLHERAHQKSHDNLMRLLLLILPDSLPFFSLTGLLDRHCKRLVEWSADDFAVGGNRQKGISLARALVCFARHQTSTSTYALASRLVEEESALACRVERLLCPAQPSRPNRQTYIGSAVLGALTVSTFALAVHFADLSNVHGLLEVLSH